MRQLPSLTVGLLTRHALKNKNHPLPQVVLTSFPKRLTGYW